MSSKPIDVDQYDFDLAPDVEVSLDSGEYRRIMDRIMSSDQQNGGRVSAFNSSI
jgi:hypothetical protein